MIPWPYWVFYRRLNQPHCVFRRLWGRKTYNKCEYDRHDRLKWYLDGHNEYYRFARKYGIFKYYVKDDRKYNV